MVKTSVRNRQAFQYIAVVAFAMTAAAGAHAALCGTGSYPFPYTDVASVNDAFCRGIMESYTLGVTKGTTATTFSPNQNVDRTQMTTFLQRSIDQGLRRSSRRNVLGQWWTPKTSDGLQIIALPGAGPAGFCKSDGQRVWVANGENVVSVQSSTGELASVIPGSPSAIGGVVVANGRVYATDFVAHLMIDIKPSWLSPFYISTNTSIVAYHPNNLTFDGDRIWTANYTDGTITIIGTTASAPNSTLNLPGTLVSGFTAPIDVLFDGANVWTTDSGVDSLHKLNAAGGIVQTVATGDAPGYMGYDGANIWVPNLTGNSITVVQASTGAVVATIATNASNRLSTPIQAAFDGERILVTNVGNDSVTLFRAADLSLIGNIPLAPGSGPIGACSDGINFWVTLRGSKELLRL